MRIKVLLIGLVTSLFLVCVCNLGNNPSSAANPDLKIFQILPNTISTFQEDSSGFEIFRGDSMYAPMDGGISMYIDSGLIELAREKFTTTDSAQGWVWIMDFGTAQKATHMYNYKLKNAVNIVNVTGFANTTAFIDIGQIDTGTVPTAASAYCHFDRFYFEIPSYGYANGIQPAYDLIEKMIKFYQSKTSQ